MKLTYRDLVAAKKLLPSLLNVAMKPDAAFKMADNVVEIDKHLLMWHTIENEVKSRHLNNLGDNKTNVIDEVFKQDWLCRLEEEIDINISQLNKSDIIGTISPSVVISLRWLFRS